MNQTWIPLSVPNLKGNELKYVTAAVTGEWVSTAGAYVSDFEQKIAEYLGVSGAVSCQSGTAGLHVGLQLCGVGPGDAVIVPTLTFIAAVNPVKYLGAEPIFMDCDDSLCMDMEKLERFCREECDWKDGQLIHRAGGRPVKAVVPVHIFGNLADLDSLMPLAEKYGLKVVEDATEALGSRFLSGRYAGRYAGTIGDFGVYSFNGNKIITTGGGGMMVARAEADRLHAKHLTQQAKSDEVRFEHDEIGYNYRLTNLQAALGLAQLEQLENFIGHKKENYERYQKAIRELPGLKFLDFRPDIRANYWFYSLYLTDEFPLSREELMQYLMEQKVQTRPIWGLIHQQKPYQGSRTYQIEKAVNYRDRVLNLPCSTNLTAADVDRVIAVICQAGK